MDVATACKSGQVHDQAIADAATQRVFGKGAKHELLTNAQKVTVQTASSKLRLTRFSCMDNERAHAQHLRTSHGNRSMRD